MKVKNNILIFENNEKIIDYLEDKSNDMIDYINSSNDSNFTLIRKFITHSDLPTYAKKTWKEQELNRNLLYYLSSWEMNDIELRENKTFEVAKQSNILIPSIFYEKLWIEQLKRRSWNQKTQHNHKIINDYASVYLVNETMEYFSIDYTFKIIEKLDKTVNWIKKDFIQQYEWSFTPIRLTHAIHWIWTKEDTTFHNLRRNIFKNDSLILLIEELKDWTKKVFIILDKNPRFFSILNETNKSYEKFMLKEKKLSENVKVEMFEEEKTRKFQNVWRNKLAEEMMNYTVEDNKIFCPFTWIEADFTDMWTLYRASHIKAFSDCDVKEAFDIDNWLLLVANADALFDKHLITVSENKQLMFSFLIEHDYKLKSRLLLNQEIFQIVLNEKRMLYLKKHREVFLQKENERKK